jgi:hypothetical protein
MLDSTASLLSLPMLTQAIRIPLLAHLSFTDLRIYYGTSCSYLSIRALLRYEIIAGQELGFRGLTNIMPPTLLVLNF